MALAIPIAASSQSAPTAPPTMVATTPNENPPSTVQGCSEPATQANGHPQSLPWKSSTRKPTFPILETHTFQVFLSVCRRERPSSRTWLSVGSTGSGSSSSPAASASAISAAAGGKGTQHRLAQKMGDSIIMPSFVDLASLESAVATASGSSSWPAASAPAVSCRCQREVACAYCSCEGPWISRNVPGAQRKRQCPRI